jgi:chromosome segregation ATPase
VDAWFEDQAKALQGHINQLKEKLDEKEHEAAQEASLGKPRLRDRNRFFNSLLNGELAVYEKVGPRWRGIRQLSGEIGKVKQQLAAAESKINSIILRGVRDEPEYLSLRAGLSRAKAIRSSCAQLIDAIHKAQKSVAQAKNVRLRDETSRAAVDRHASEVYTRVQAVRNHMNNLDNILSPTRSFDAKDFMKLDFGHLDSKLDNKARVAQYKSVETTLRSVEGVAKSLIGSRRAEEKEFSNQLRAYVDAERRRFS